MNSGRGNQMIIFQNQDMVLTTAGQFIEKSGHDTLKGGWLNGGLPALLQLSQRGLAEISPGDPTGRDKVAPETRGIVIACVQGEPGHRPRRISVGRGIAGGEPLA